MNNTAPPTELEQRLRDVNEALLISGIRQHELAEQVETANVVVRDSHARFESLFDVSPVGMYVVDADLRVRLVSRNARPVFGGIEGLIGSDLANVLHVLWPPESADEIESRFRRTLETGDPYIAAGYTEVRHDRKVREYYDWQIHRIHLPDGRDGVVCFFVDISDRVLAEKSLKASEERFRNLADNMSQFAWTCDQLGTVTWYNRRWLDYTGLTFEEMKGWGWTQCQHPDHVDRVVAGVERSRESGEPWDDTFPLRGNDGVYRWFLSRAVPIRDDQGNVLQWFGTNTDVTEQRQMAEELRRNAVHMAESDRRKDEFLAMLGHELRNPLAPLANAIHLLRMQEHEDPVQQEARAIIERQVAQLTRLVEDLMEVSRVTTGRLQLRPDRIVVGGVVERAVETVRPLMEQHRHELTVSLPPEPIWLFADAARLEQVVVNLLANAAKYTHEAGHVWLSVEASGEECVLRVRDTGVGIAPELLPRVFDLFTQAERSLDRSQGGLGIGLALVQRLVEMHRGQVEVHSILGQGSEFVVRLPTVPAPVGQPTSTPPQPSRPPGASLRILVVDDNVDSAKSLAMLLRRSHHEVCTAHDGPDALAAALEFRPGVVLLDIGLPGMDGYEVARRIRGRQETRNALLIAMTGYGQESDRLRARDAGFDHHMVKPADFDTLRKLLAAAAAPGT